MTCESVHLLTHIQETFCLLMIYSNAVNALLVFLAHVCGKPDRDVNVIIFLGRQ